MGGTTSTLLKISCLLGVMKLRKFITFSFCERYIDFLILQTGYEICKIVYEVNTLRIVTLLQNTVLEILEKYRNILNNDVGIAKHLSLIHI